MNSFVLHFSFLDCETTDTFESLAVVVEALREEQVNTKKPARAF